MTQGGCNSCFPLEALAAFRIGLPTPEPGLASPAAAAPDGSAPAPAPAETPAEGSAPPPDEENS